MTRSATGGPTFPFSAVVGNDDAKLALLLSAIDPHVGGVLLRGDKGTAKTTLARGLAALLPGDAPFAELPLGASGDRVTGSIDLAAVLADGSRRFEPGVLAAADGGVLYVDEINLLADHLVDVVLDAAASGRNRVERDGVSHEHPARFVLIGSMNPEEGELRPQLLDRFGLMVDVGTPAEPQTRVEAVDRRLAFDDDPDRFVDEWSGDEAELRKRLTEVAPARVDGALRLAIARLCVSFGVEGLRADLVMTRAAAALACWENRTEASEDDLLRVAPLVLAHRRRRGPFDEPGIDLDELSEAWDRARDQHKERGSSTNGDGDRSSDAIERNTGETGTPQMPADPSVSGGHGSEREPAPRPADSPPSSVAAIGAYTMPDAAGTRAAGRAARAATDRPGTRTVSEGASTPDARRGREIGDRAPDGPMSSVAVHASVMATAMARGSDPHAAPVIREAVHERIRGRLVVLCVDASGSMNTSQRMEAAKGVALGLLTNAYQRRDQVAMVTFGGDGATVALRPTSSVEVARRRLAELPSGGVTPLAEGLQTAHDLIARSSSADDALLVVISDGRASSGPDGQDPLDAAHAVAADIARSGIESVVVDAETSAVRLGLAAELARHLGATVAPLPTAEGELAAALQRATP